MARRLLVAVPVPVGLVLFWHLAVTQGWTTLIPAPGEVGTQLWDFAFGGVHDDAYSASLLTHLWASARRVITGFCWAVTAAVPLGVLMGRSRRLSAMLEPTVGLLRPIPVTAWVPLVLIIFGLGSRSAVILIFIASFYPILLNTIAGVKAVPPRLLEAAAMLGTRGWRVLSRVVIPSSLPSILGGMRIALGFAWVVVVVGETVGVPTGLGSVITEGREISNTALIMAGMVFIGLAGFLTDKLMTGVIRLALRRRPLVAT